MQLAKFGCEGLQNWERSVIIKHTLMEEISSRNFYIYFEKKNYTRGETTKVFFLTLVVQNNALSLEVSRGIIVCLAYRSQPLFDINQSFNILSFISIIHFQTNVISTLFTNKSQKVSKLCITGKYASKYQKEYILKVWS